MFNKLQEKNPNQNLKIGVVVSIVVIVIITILEFPPPIGFETRPQNNVSMFWLFFFLTIVITETATIPLILKIPKLGWKFGITAGVLNILQVISDQLHLIQPEVAPLEYSLLELSVVIVSFMLIYFSLRVKK